ncbi:ABC transporter permease [Natronomonas halophila]|uniref:ABC transporter permease n=1 Tax=Natronomonas halophila TaxID=2747817 RepID=UPI0015B444C1|nr:ABC transporter permease [Natronomonas halophila]QLD84862.1 ABC transporter permease [Natronomonas halophila]
MSLLRLVAQRIALGVIAAWAVLTTVFLAVMGTKNWHLETILALEGRGGTTPEKVREIRTEYLSERGLDRPLHEQYVDWMSGMFTLQWGESFQTGEAVFPMVMSATARTAMYVVPALAVALVVGLAVGLYAAMSERSASDTSTRGLTYLLFGLPNFWVGAMVLSLAGIGVRFGQRSQAIRPSTLPFLYEYVLPILLVATTLSAAIVSYARSYSLQYVSADLTKLVRAKGGGRLTVARHVLRNAAIPLVSLAFVETLALIALSMFVIEALFTIEGLGLVFYNAIWTSDLPVLMGATLVIAAVGVVGNITQDLAYTALDPRVDTGSR